MINSVSSVKSSVPLSGSVGSNRKIRMSRKESCINSLSYDVERVVFSYLKLSDLRAVCLSDRRRNEVVSTPFYQGDASLKDKIVYRDFAFSSIDWKRHYKKDVDTEGEDIFFSKNIYKELNKPCKVFLGKRIGQTHMLTWIPKNVDGEPLTLNSFGRVLKEHFPKNRIGYRIVWDPIFLKHGNTGLPRSGWVFMTGDVIPNSRRENYEVQKELVFNLDRRDPYKVPTALKAAVCISTNYFKSGERRYTYELWTYTRCQEPVQGCRVSVGGLATNGIEVNKDGYGYDGMGALRSSVFKEKLKREEKV